MKPLVVLTLAIAALSACSSGSTASTSTGSSSGDEATIAHVRLIAESRGEDENGAPRADVHVEVALGDAAPTNIAVGDLPGCGELEDGTGTVLRSVRCSWAGGGDVVTVSHEGGAIIVRRQGEDSQAEGELPNEEIGRVEIGAASVELTP